MTKMNSTNAKNSSQPPKTQIASSTKNHNLYGNLQINLNNNAGNILNDSSMLDRDETSIGNSMENIITTKQSSLHNPSIDKQKLSESENKKKIDIKNLINQSKIKRLDNQMKSVKI